ncbi:mannose-6-phosphate isomerase-like protein (cupin superfamily) [Paraburkholderia sp. CI3]
MALLALVLLAIFVIPTGIQSWQSVRLPNRSTSKPRSATWSKYWSPKVVTQVNDQYLKIAKVRGQLVWHERAEEDERSPVVRGHLKIEYEGGRVVDLRAGSMHVVPRGTLRNPWPITSAGSS